MPHGALAKGGGGAKAPPSRIQEPDIGGRDLGDGWYTSVAWQGRLKAFGAKCEEYGPVRPQAGATLDELFVYQLRRYDWVNLTRVAQQVKDRLHELEERVERTWSGGPPPSRRERVCRLAVVLVSNLLLLG